MSTSIRGLRALPILTGILLAAGTGASTEGDEEAVREVAAPSYNALNTMFTGDLEPMKEVWSHVEDVTYRGPAGGFQMGWKSILAIWEAQAALKLRGKVESAGMRITVGHDLAITHHYEEGENKGPDGNALSVSIRATNIFRKEQGKRKVIGRHTDLLPFLNK